MSKFDTTLLLCDAAGLLCNRQTKYMQEKMEIMLIGPTRFLILKNVETFESFEPRQVESFNQMFLTR